MKKPPRCSAEEHQAQLRVLEEFRPLVARIVGGFMRKVPRNVLREDLLAAAMGGLWDAIVRDGGKRDGAFEWYARVRIRGAILDELRAEDWLPRRARDRVVYESAPIVIRLDDMTETEAERALVVEPSEQSDMMAHARINAAITRLPQRDAALISRYFYAGEKLHDIADAFGVTEARASQIKARAIGRIREILREEQ